MTKRRRSESAHTKSHGTRLGHKREGGGGGVPTTKSKTGSPKSTGGTTTSGGNTGGASTGSGNKGGQTTGATGSGNTIGGTSGGTAPGATPPGHTSPQIDDAKLPCVYSSDHISMLDQFGDAVGRSFQCAMVYNDAAPNWYGWETPWFLSTYADMSWGQWATAPGTHRTLVITQNLFPGSENSADWLELGASGAFESYARTLATNLVSAGLGSAIIRLAPEANGDWESDSIPNTPAGDQQWIQFWRNTVIAMRSVPGANFQFDWTVNENYRDVPLSSFYPGDDVVDIIGIDAYDAAVAPGLDRWSTIYGRPDGIEAVADFAKAHGKPLSIPEWGIEPAQDPTTGSGGDDPEYVNGIASVVANDDVAYQSYFDSGEEGIQFFNSPLSVLAYSTHFGAAGDAVSSSDRGPQVPTPSPAPALAITGGPPYASTVSSTSVTFTFAAQPGYTAVCSLDGQPWRACSGATSDALTNLSQGFHTWNVQVSDASDDVTLLGRTFVVASQSGADVRKPAR